METFEPLNTSKLPIKESSEALASLMFLTDKMNISIKGRTCEIGIKLQAYINNKAKLVLL